MKKFYAFAMAALMSASMFAANPTAADLANAGFDVNNNVVLCVHFVGDANVCNAIYFKGTFSGWDESWTNCPQFAALAGFDGWYAAEAAYADGFQGKPIQAKTDGSFSWDFQPGDPAAWTHVGGLEATLETEYGTQTKASFAAAGAYIYEISYWQNHGNPCVVAAKHKYTIKLYSPNICGDFKPAIGGGFNSWGITEMSEGLDDDFETVYTLVIEDEEGQKFKFRPTDDDEQWSKQLQFNDKGEDKWENGADNILPVATKDTTLVFDYSDDTKYRWAACDSEAASQVYVTLIAPAGAPALVQVVGSFDTWTGTDMNYKEGKWEALISAKSSDAFKFRSGIPVPEAESPEWGNQIQEFVNEDWANMENMEFGEKWIEGEDYNTVNCDFSDPALYRWTIENQQGIENVVLTEKAQKVVVDGVIYIIRNNKMFNLQGAQVR